MKCMYCGVELRQNDTVCWNCGKPVPQRLSTSTDGNDNKKSIWQKIFKK